MRSKFRIRLLHPLQAVLPFALLLLLYLIARLYFLATNRAAFQQSGVADLFSAFFLGFKFDLAFLVLWNSLFLLFWILPLDFLNSFRKRAAMFGMILFLFLNLPPWWSNFLDAEYFPFSGRRSTRAVFAMFSDMGEQVKAEFFRYWYIALIMLLSVIIGAGVLMVWKRYVRAHAKYIYFGKYSYPVFVSVLIFISVLSVRGGFQTKPLGPWHAFQLPSTSLGALALNTPFSLVRSDAKQVLPKLSYFVSTDEARAVLRGKASGVSSFLPRRSNVVIFVLESFALEFFGEHPDSPTAMPFLKSLSSRGLSFDYSFANGRSSIIALPSVLSGVPTLMDEPYVTSIYNGTRVNGIASILKERGYASHFFHGGRNGSMYFDTAARLAGFEHYYGLNEYPNKQDYDGTWGVFDESMYRFAASILDKEKPPFVAGFFSLSSHSPYKIPAPYVGKFPKGNHAIFESLGYADNALRVFFELASKSEWFNDTIFVFTADHSIDGNDARFMNELSRFRTPIIYYDTAGKLPKGRWPVVTQQADIVPSLLDALGINPNSAKLPPFGFSVFDRQAPRRAAWYIPGSIALVSDGVMATAGEGEATQMGEPRLRSLSADMISLTPDVPVEENTKAKVSNDWKAFLHFYHNALNENSLLGW